MNSQYTGYAAPISCPCFITSRETKCFPHVCTWHNRWRSAGMHGNSQQSAVYDIDYR